MVTHGEKANSGRSSGHFWNYVNVLCKKGLQGKRENPWDKGTFTQVSEVKSSKWSLPTESSCSPPSPGEAVLRKAAKGFWSPGWLLTGSACSLTVKEKPRIWERIETNKGPGCRNRGCSLCRESTRKLQCFQGHSGHRHHQVVHKRTNKKGTVRNPDVKHKISEQWTHAPEQVTMLVWAPESTCY